MTKNICADCGEILVDNASLCQNCHSENFSENKISIENGVRSAKLEVIGIFIKARRYEEAAKLYEQLEMRDKAEDCRRMGKKRLKTKRKTRHVVSTNLTVGKVAAISMNCPHCNSSQLLDSKSNVSKSNEVVCSYCQKNYIIPQKVLDLI
jgi:RNA polymerase subunit RPABC4/transcription elongation factor Spt4